MRGAIKLFNIFNIAIYIHWTFILLPVLFFYYGGLKGVALILFVFACVTAHELFHSVMAKRFGVKVSNITLFPIGGVASMGNIPTKPSQEFLIALAGPAFNIIFSLVMFYPLYRFLGPDVLFNPSLESWPNTIAEAFWINPWLAGFNLLPAFPMDGGRLLRAILAKRLGLRRATRIAVGIGHFFAIVFAIYGIYKRQFMLIIIAAFIYSAASNEGFQVEYMESLKAMRDTKDFDGHEPEDRI